MSGILTAFIGRVAGVVTDAYFNLVTLLLPGNGTNGAQNNTFLDSSSNTFTITRNGNTTQGTFSPFSQTGWSNYLDGNSSVRVTSTSAVFDITGNFTVEGWYYITAVPGTGDLFGIEEDTSGWAAVQVQINTGRTLTLNISTAGGSWASSTTSTGTIALNTWNHIAVVRNGLGSNNITVYVNGVSFHTATVSTANLYSGGAFSIIGGRNAAGYMTGYVSNFRYIKGTALYTSNFTPSTSLLTTTSQGATAAEVELLTCQSNRFVDNSDNAFTITITNAPSVQPFSPFLPTIPYSAATVGGSGYFDGTGDYLSLPTSNSTLLLGSGDFSVEAFFYMTTRNALNTIYSYGTGSGNFRLFIESTKLTIWNGSSTLFTYTFTFPTNSWFHLVVTRASGTLRIFIDGVLQANGANSTNFNAGTLNIGADAGGNLYTGYLSSSRIVVGGIPFAYSTSSTTNGTQIFTPPTAPFTGSESLTAGSVVLRANYTNASIIDATAKNDLETVGNAQISTTQSKFGGSSIAFDGNGDYLQLPSNPTFAMGSGDWTVEMWLYPNSVASLQGLLSFGSGAWRFFLNNSGLWFLSGSGSIVQTSQSIITTGQWYHVAVCKSGSSARIFLNGSQVGSTGTDNGTYAAATAYIGSEAAGSYLNGFIDDLRVTRGFARYTANFTAPTAAFPLQ